MFIFEEGAAPNANVARSTGVKYVSALDPNCGISACVRTSHDHVIINVIVGKRNVAVLIKREQLEPPLTSRGLMNDSLLAELCDDEK